MKIEIKLRDLTKEQFQKWKYDNCNLICTQCPFAGIDCVTSEWINHKNIFNNKFLKQTIEYTPDILDKKEHDYLEAVIKPWKEKVEDIVKYNSYDGAEYILISLHRPDQDIYLPEFPKGTMYKGMKTNVRYTLEKLGL